MTLLAKIPALSIWLRSRLRPQLMRRRCTHCRMGGR
jgi:hypothetical protein